MQQQPTTVTVTTVELEGSGDKDAPGGASKHSPQVSEGYESGSVDLDLPGTSGQQQMLRPGLDCPMRPEETGQAHLYSCEYCPDTFLSRSGRESHLEARHGIRQSKRIRQTLNSATGLDLHNGDVTDDDEEEENGDEEEGRGEAFDAASIVAPAILGPSGQYPVRTDVRTTAVQCLYCNLKFAGGIGVLIF